MTRKKVEQTIEVLIAEIGSTSILPVLSVENSCLDKQQLILEKKDFPKKVSYIKMNQLYIKKEGLSQKALSMLKRMAAFQNPEFYQAQAMRKSTWQIQRMISCSDENEEYLVLPRGLKEKIEKLLNELSVSFEAKDRTFKGNELAVSFKGKLRPEQKIAAEKMLLEDTGILCGTTAFGKTVVALNMIAERKVNTLILVNKTSLVEQWQEKIEEFLTFEKEEDKSVGQLGGGKRKLTNKIDIALLQSMYRKEKVHESIYNYGMVIVDECHHISAFSFEKVLKQANAKYVYGLTATPIRKDGHEPIIFMQCGSIRYRDDAKKQTEKRPFDHTVITKFMPLNSEIYHEMTLQEIYLKIAESHVRNENIIEDIVDCYKEGRNSIILTERVSHVEALENNLIKTIPDVIAITGAMSKKKRTEKMKRIKEAPLDKPLTIISTGKYIGEGFDEPRLDTLFLAMPISFKGRVQQYAGRLHRLYDGKVEVRIYDYCDIHVPVLERMYQKRLSSYSSMGYLVKINEKGINQRSLIYTKDNYFDQLKLDIRNAKIEIIIASPTLVDQSIKRLTNDQLNFKGDSLIFSVVTTDYHALKNKSHRENQKKLVQQLKAAGFSVTLQLNVQQQCVIIDSKIAWYGNIDVLGKNKAESSFIRLESPLISKEIKEILKLKSQL
ncbi:DEAD/DEAH box helicase family protein [Carnobacterium sp. TMP28]|uniref:DEAD/DEAH box helicase family protein n=1 Tax=Carnobacterium sp. TMP28 TaxID=3397060 RepID=UPI0039E032D9